MTAPIYGSGFVDLMPRMNAGGLAGFGSSLTSAMGPVAAGAGAALAAGIGVALAGGVALLKIGETFDDAFDEIRIGTGATGDALAGLESDFKDVFAAVPTDTASAASAVADLNTRLGLTGDELQARSAQFLELSRITGTDLSSSIESATRVFGDWGVAVEDQEGTLDAMFRASQATGIGVDALGSQLVQYGAPLRQLGFGFETSAALLGKFEKEGVNAELVLGSLRIALGKMARDGEDAETTFARVTEEIETAGSASEANALALELFGARAGPDMAAAIREGRFELGDLFDTVAGGTETIRGAAEDTNDWRQSLEIMKNRALVALEPIATRVFQGFGNLIEAITPALERAIGFVSSFFDTVSNAFSGNGISAGPLSEVASKIGEVFGRVAEVVRVIFDGLVAFWNEWGDEIMGVLSAAWSAISSLFSAALDVIVGIFDVVLGILTGDWTRVWDGFKSILAGAWDAITGSISALWDALVALFGGGLETIGTAVVDGFGNLVGWFADLPGRLLEAVGDLGSLLYDVGADIVRGLWDGITSLTGWIGEKITGFAKSAIPGPIKSALGISSPSKLAAQLGAAIPQGLAAGILGEMSLVEDAALRAAAQALPPLDSPTSRAIASATAIRRARGFDSPAVAAGAGINVGNVTVNNPIGEPSEDSIARALSASLAPYINV